MSSPFIAGVAGGFAKAPFSPGGFVAMSSPCPYAQWDYTQHTTTGVVTRDTTWVRVTSTGIFGGGFPYGVSFDMLMLHVPGKNTLRCVLTSNSTTSYYAYIELNGGVLTFTIRGISWSYGAPLPDPPAPSDIPVPYYRYRISCQLRAQGPAGTWGQINFSLI